MSCSALAGVLLGEEVPGGRARGIVLISRSVFREGRRGLRGGADWFMVVESQPGVERAAAGGVLVGGVVGWADGWAALGLAFLAWASQASRVAWSTGHFSDGSEVMITGCGFGLLWVGWGLRLECGGDDEES